MTVSRLKTWRDCKRKHRLMYIDGWRIVRKAAALREGDIGHVGLEAWWKDDGTDRIGVALDAMKGMGEDAYEQAAMEELLKGYDYVYGDQMDRYVVHAVEESFTLPLINPKTGAPSRTWTLAGKVDGVLRDLQTGALLILEHKLTADSFAEDSDRYWLKLGMDAQVSHYFLGAESLGFPAEGCLYDVLLRPRQKPLKATPMESRKYVAKTGALYANQRAEDETPDQFRARVAADISDHPTKYFQRRVIGRMDKDIIEYLGEVWEETQMMRAAELAGVATKNPESCHRFSTCSYWDICAYGLNPADHPETFERVENVHPELELETA